MSQSSVLLFIMAALLPMWHVRLSMPRERRPSLTARKLSVWAFVNSISDGVSATQRCVYMPVTFSPGKLHISSAYLTAEAISAAFCASIPLLLMPVSILICDSTTIFWRTASLESPHA